MIEIEKRQGNILGILVIADWDSQMISVQRRQKHNLSTHVDHSNHFSNSYPMPSMRCRVPSLDFLQRQRFWPRERRRSDRIEYFCRMWAVETASPTNYCALCKEKNRIRMRFADIRRSTHKLLRSHRCERCCPGQSCLWASGWPVRSRSTRSCQHKRWRLEHQPNNWRAYSVL